MPFRVSMRAKQVLGVTVIVALATSVLTLLCLAALVRVWLVENQARGELVASTAAHRAFVVAAADTTGDLSRALREDPGLRSILESAIFSNGVTFAAVTDAQNVILSHSDHDLEGKSHTPGASFKDLIGARSIEQVRAIYTPGGRTYEVSQPLMLNGAEFGAIRVGLSTLLIRGDVDAAFYYAALWMAGVLVATILIATVLTNMLLRPIHVISSGVARLGRGEFDMATDLPDDAELRDVSQAMKAIGARLAAGGDSHERDARRLTALSRLTAGVAHEIKNPLNAMSIHLELLRGQLKGSREAAEHLSVLSTQLRRLDDVVQTFLKFARPDPLTLKPESLVSILEGIRPVVEAEAGGAGVRLEMDCPPDLPNVEADASSLQNALMNLAINACQAMPNGGTLTISAVAVPNNRVEIHVTDTGVGIPADQLEKIFNLYFTTKPNGSGIGLPMVYRTIEHHGGDISVESVPGRGTTFTVTLKAVPGR